MRRDELRRFAGGREQLRDLLRLGRRLQLPEAFCAHRRQGEALDRLDDPIEFEGPKGAGLHKGEPLILPYRTATD